MNFKEWLLNEEIFPNKTATVYHRTKSIKDVSSILTSDYKVGTGCYYGCGLYTTFAIESQFTNYMKMYGEALIKFKVTGLDKYLIFQLSVAKQIHGKDYKISDQLKKLGVLNKVNPNSLEYYDKRQEKEKNSATLAKEFYESNDWIANSVKGIIYYGSNDGYCLVKYPTVQDGTITMWGYAVAEADNQQKMEQLRSNIGWIKSVGTLGTPIKTAYKAPDKMKKRFEFGDKSEIENVKNIFLTSKNLEKTAQKLELHINNFTYNDILDLVGKSKDKDEMAEVIIKYKKNLSYNDVDSFLYSAINKDKIAELIVKNKPDISYNNVGNLIHHVKEKDKIAELIIKYKKEIYDNVAQLLQAATDKEKDKIAELIIKKQPELSNINVSQLLVFTTNKEKIAELLGTDNINKLSDKNISSLLGHATEKDEIAKLIIEKKPELSDNNVFNLLYYATNKDKIAELLGKDNINKLADDNVVNLLSNATNKEKIAEILGSDNINKLTDESVRILLQFATDIDKMAQILGSNNINKLSDHYVEKLMYLANEKRKMAQILNKYHTKKTPEIQEIIDKYLHEL